MLNAQSSMSVTVAISVIQDMVAADLELAWDHLTNGNETLAELELASALEKIRQIRDLKSQDGSPQGPQGPQAQLTFDASAPSAGAQPSFLTSQPLGKMTETKTRKNEVQLEILPRSSAEKLDQHAKNIGTYIKGSQKGAGELFGYAYLAGREMLLAKAVIPNGHSHSNNAGFKDWIEARFPKFGYRTAARWMQFADSVTLALAEKAGADISSKSDPGSLSAKQPLVLRKGKLTVRDRASILQAVVSVMDGKTMTDFMRDSRFLRDPEKPTHHPRKPVSPDKALAARKKQALSHWTTTINDLTLGCTVAQYLDIHLIQQALDTLVETGNALRELLKARKLADKADSK
jgi:hypothetical protein